MTKGEREGGEGQVPSHDPSLKPHRFLFSSPHPQSLGRRDIRYVTQLDATASIRASLRTPSEQSARSGVPVHAHLKGRALTHVGKISFTNSPGVDVRTSSTLCAPFGSVVVVSRSLPQTVALSPTLSHRGLLARIVIPPAPLESFQVDHLNTSRPVHRRQRQHCSREPRVATVSMRRTPA